MREEEKKEMSEPPATRQQIKKLYVVIRNCGLNPTEQVRKLRAEQGPFTKAGISKLIDQFQDLDRKKEVVDVPEENGDVKADKEAVNDLDGDQEERLKKIDALFSECVVKASNTLSRMLLPEGEQPQVTMVMELAKLYFGEIHKGRS